jgi:hypothetical protein
MERQSRDEKKHVTKDVVGLLLGGVVSTKNTHIVAKDVVGLLLREVVSTKIITHRRKGCVWLTSRRYRSKNDCLTKMKTYCTFDLNSPTPN